MIDEIDDTDTSIPREVSGFGDVLEEGKESEHFSCHGIEGIRPLFRMLPYHTSPT